MMAQPTSTPTLAAPAPASQTSAIEAGDPIWRHVKSAWDRQFVQRPNFIPWLRAQLEVDPIDEQSPNPEPLVSYIKRRLTLIQSQQAPQTDGQPKVVEASQPAYSNAPSTQSNNLTSVNGARLSISSGNDQVDNSSQALSSQPPSQSLVQAPGYTSQLGAIADAHMGSPATAIASNHSLNPLATVQSQNQVYHQNHAQQPNSPHNHQHSQRAFSCELSGNGLRKHSNDQHEQVHLQAQRHVQNHQRQQVQLPNQENQQQDFLLLQPGQRDQQPKLPYAHQTQLMSPSPSPLNLQGSLHHHDQHSQSNPHQLSSSAFAGLFQFGNSLGTQKSPNQMAVSDPMSSLIHPNLLGSGTSSTSLSWQNVHPELGMELPVIPAAVQTSYIGPSSLKPTETSVPLIDQPRTTRSNAAAAKNSIQSGKTSTSHPVKSVPATVNGSSVNKPSRASIEQQAAVTQKAPDPYDRKAWKSRLSTVRAELDHIPKAPTRTANKLIKILSMYTISPTPLSGDWSTVPPDGRLEFLSAIKTSANREFFTAWAAESKGLAILEAWLKGSVHSHERAKSRPADNDVDFQERDGVLVSLLQMLEKLPITLEHLTKHNFAKQVLRINKEVNAPKFSENVKTLSKKLEQEWRATVRGASANKANNTESASKDVKKRNEPPPEPAQVKKRKVEVASKATAAQTNSNNKANDVPFGKIDRPKLPAFVKKKPEPVATATSTAPRDPFAEAMAALREKNLSSGMGEVNMTATVAPKAKIGGKPAKRVTFASDDKLCQIKIVDRLVYEGEEYETHPVGDARKMDAIEGRYLHHAEEFLEEEMEWVTPSEIVMTPETIANLETSPLDSPQIAIQEEREKAVVEVIYYDESQIPETPQEPPEGERGTEDGSDHIPKMMKLGGDLVNDPEVARWIAQAQADNIAADAPVAPDHTVSDILARLSGASMPQMAPQSGFHPGIDLDLLSSLSQAGSLQALLAASSQGTMGAMTPTHPAALDPDPFRNGLRADNGWGAAAGSASANNGWGAAAGSASVTAQQDIHIPTGPSAGVGGSKKSRRKNRGAKDAAERKFSAYDKFGRHIKCKWWPDCPHGNRCYYKHGD